MWHTIHKNVKAGIECFDGLFSCAERKAITKTGEEVSSPLVTYNMYNKNNKMIIGNNN